MPQLNPAPWFMVLVFSWMVFLIVLPPKVTAHTFPNELTRQTSHTYEADSWSWPWH